MAASKKIRFLEKGVEKNDANALVELAYILRSGLDSVEKNVPRAMCLYERAAAQGHVIAMNNLGLLLQHGSENIIPDAVRSKSFYENAYFLGNNKARVNMAHLLSEGAPGVTQNGALAKELYQQAITIRETKALTNLAFLDIDVLRNTDHANLRTFLLQKSSFLRGNMSNYFDTILKQGNTINKKKTVILPGLSAFFAMSQTFSITQSISQLILDTLDNLKARRVCSDLDVLSFIDFEELSTGTAGINWDSLRTILFYEKDVASWHSDPLTGLANLLASGVGGVDRDIVRSKSLYEDAIYMGDSNALVGLSNLFVDGEDGIDCDPRRSQQLLEEAVEKNNMYGRVRLGILLSAGGGDGVEKDVGRAKNLFEEAIEHAQVVSDFKLRGEAMSYFAHMFMFGYGQNDDLHSALLLDDAKRLLKECANNGFVVSMLGLGILLQHGDDSAQNQLKRSTELFEKVLVHPDCFKRISYDLGSAFQFIFQSIGLDVTSIPSQIFKTTRRPAKHYGRIFLACLIFVDLNSNVDDIGRARNFFRQFLDDEKDDHVSQFVESAQQTLQQYRLSKCTLQMAYADVIAQRITLTESMIMETIAKENVCSIQEVIGGHNILSLAQKQGLIAESDTNSATNLQWYIERNLYIPASRLMNVDLGLLEFIFRDAEVKGIIRNGITFVISTELSADIAVAKRQMNNAFEKISHRFLQVEENISASFKFATNISKDLNKLHDLMILSNKAAKYSALASCLLSFIPIIGKGIGEVARLGGEIIVGLGI